MKIVFQGPKGLTPPPPGTPALTVTDPTGNALAGLTLSNFTINEAEPTTYTLEWSGPWPESKSPWPKGNYKLVVNALQADGKTPLSSNVSDPNATLSLVEVTGVAIEPIVGGAPVDNDPPVGLHAEEPRSNRVARLGGGLRVFAEAPQADQPALDQVKVVVATDPAVPQEVPVALRLLDVDDPDGSPIDRDADDPAKEPSDNYGTGRLASTATVPAGGQTTSTPLTLSHYPGDNYRVAASTSGEWLAKLRAHQPSQTGEVWDEIKALPEGGALTESPLSKMVTVWRTLHLEIDSMKPAPTDPTADERNFVLGRVRRMEGHEGRAIRLFLLPDAPPKMDKLRDASVDRSGTGDDHGDGRFQRGTIRVGSGSEADSSEVDRNGLDYVERFSILSDGQVVHAFSVLFDLQDIDGRSLVRGFVVSGEPERGNFVLWPRSAGWSEAQSSAIALRIGGVTWPLKAGSVGPLQQSGDIFVGDVLAAAGRELPFRLTDDDRATAPFVVDTRLLQTSDLPTTNALAAAYIRPSRLDRADTNRADFKRNVECPPLENGDCDTTQIARLLLQGRDSLPPLSSSGYWLAYLQGAFQPGENVDADPDEERATVGATVGLATLFGSQIYAEPIADTPWDADRDRCGQTVPAHELGHQLGVGEVDRDGIMRANCSSERKYFDAESLRRIRSMGVNP